MQTDLRLGSKVEDQDGKLLGEIKQLIMSDDNKQVKQVVVSGPRQEWARLVEAKQISGVGQDKDTVRLNLSKEKFEKLPEYNQKDYDQSQSQRSGATRAPDEPRQDRQPQVTGGYSLDPNADLDPPGLAKDSK